MPQETGQVPVLRSANEADAALVLSFIRKLADYGDLASEVSATVDDIRAALFGTQRVAEAVIAYLDGHPVGFALFTNGFASFMGKPGLYIEDLYVETAHRGAGIGKALLQHVAKLGVERGCGRLEWAVLNWNEPAMEFYTDLGAVTMDDWTTFRLTGEALSRLAQDKEDIGYKIGK
jgi:GNAT superfamily N-acetyltransferase